jgi:hypothetical protein
VRFAELLESLSDAALEKLLAARGAAIDPKKILSRGEQAARALATLPPRMLASLAPSAREALERLTPAPGIARRSELGAGVRQLLDLGLAFERGDDVICPAVVRVQLPITRREDPRAARALLSAANEETVRTLMQGALRARASGARALSLGELLERLEDPHALEAEIASRAMPERLALSAIEARGGDVSGSELLALAREPARWETPGTIPKKGPAHALLTYGYLFPAGHDRFVLASEALAVAGKERREILERRRRALLDRIERSAEEPARADLARDPGPLALALWVELANGDDLPRDGRPVRRSELSRAARALDVPPERAELLVALARTLPLNALTIEEVGPKLVSTWRRTAIADESASGPRASSRAPSAIARVRELALDALSMLPRGKFVEVDDVVRAALSDRRAEGIEAGMRAQSGPALEDVIRRIVLASLPALGVVDVARDGTVRLALGAAALLAPGDVSASETAGDVLTWIDRRVVFAPHAPVTIALGLAKIARAAIDEGLVLALDPTRARPLSVDRALLARELGRAKCPEPVAEALLAALPSAVAVLHASTPARWVPIDDAALRARLLDDPKIAREVVEGGPAGGLLIHAHGSFPRIARLFAKHGVDLRDRA